MGSRTICASWVMTAFFIALLLPCLGCGDDDPTGPQPVTLTGTWLGEYTYSIDLVIPLTLSIQHGGASITGTATFEDTQLPGWTAPMREGIFKADSLYFMLDIRDVDPEDDEQLYFSGALSNGGIRINGEAVGVSHGQVGGTFSWWVARQ